MVQNSVLYQSSCKFCLHLYLGSVAQLPERDLLHTIAVYIVHSLAVKKESLSEFCVRFQVFCDVQCCHVGSVAGSLQQRLYHFHCANRIPRAHPRGGGGLPGCNPRPNHAKLKFNKHIFCRYYDIKNIYGVSPSSKISR